MIWQFLIKRPCYSDITIETNSLTVVSILKDVFGEGYMARDKKSGVTISCFKEKEKYLIGVNNASFAEFDSPIPLLHVIEAQEQLDPRFFVLHGASVGKNSTVFLLLAPSSGGKSVLTLYLCSNGLDYITDNSLNCSLMNNMEILQVWRSFSLIQYPSDYYEPMISLLMASHYNNPAFLSHWLFLSE